MDIDWNKIGLCCFTAIVIFICALVAYSNFGREGGTLLTIIVVLFSGRTLYDVVRGK